MINRLIIVTSTKKKKLKTKTHFQKKTSKQGFRRREAGDISSSFLIHTLLLLIRIFL